MRLEHETGAATPATSAIDGASVPGIGEATHAAWLTEDVLVVAGWVAAAGDTDSVAVARPNGELLDVQIASLPETAERQTDAKVMLIHFPEPAERESALGQLVRTARRRREPFGPADLTGIVTDLKTLLREAFTWLEADARAAVLEFLVTATAQHDGDGARLSASLHRAREALRERRPRSVVAADRPHIVHVEAVFALDARAFYVEGWLHTPDPDARLVLVSPEGARVDLTHRLFAYEREDVADFLGLRSDPRAPSRPGFVCFGELPAPSRRRDGWLLELHPPDEAAGAAIESRVTRANDDPEVAREVILGDLRHDVLPGTELRERHVIPAITRVQERLRSRIAVTRVEQYGAPPAAAEFSVVVPLYRRLDFLEHQLAQFVHDPELARTDLIYVLDSPEDADELTSFATQLHRLYGVSFRVVVLDRNGGFSAANNIGAGLARAPHLVLLNSDVLPDRPGWLGQLRDFYTSTPDVGAVSPKLLYEDGSIQHAGMYFDRPAGARTWANEHFFKGLAGTLPAANVARPVPAVTGACVMISRTLYERMGGLRGIYVYGDYEDSDFCLRLRDAGLASWYVPHVQLYHLEAQSYPDETRRIASQYNAWVHTSLWGEQMAAVMADFRAAAERGSTP